MLVLLVGSLDLTSAKKTHHHKTYKTGHKKSLAKTRLVPSLPTLNVAAPQNQLEVQKEPVTIPAAPLAPLAITLPILNGVNNGKHSMSQIMNLFGQRSMTSGQIKAVFNTIDTDKSYVSYFSRRCHRYRVGRFL